MRLCAGLWGESRSKGWAGARATTGAVSGKLYWEVMPQDSGLCRVGWATRAATYDIGRDKRSFGFGATGTKSHGGQFLEYGSRFGKVCSQPCLRLFWLHCRSSTLHASTPWDVPGSCSSSCEPSKVFPIVYCIAVFAHLMPILGA